MGTKTVNYNKKGLDKLPNDKPVLYRIKTDSGTLNYVGIARRGRISDRLSKHLGEIPGAKVHIEQFSNVNAAKEKETSVIARIKPKYNTLCERSKEKVEKSAIRKKIKIIPIGNSKGIRLPKETLQKYGFSDTLIVEEREDGVLLHRQKAEKKLSWEETFVAMAKEKEDWDDFETASLDGLEGDDRET